MSGVISSVLAGAVSGGAKAKLSQIREEAKQLRTESLARLQGDESRKNINLNATIARDRQKDNQDFQAEQAEQKRTHEQGLLDQELARKDAIRAEDNAKGGAIAQQYKDLASIFGDKKAKEILSQTKGDGKGGGLDAAAQAKYRTESRKMAVEELGPEADSRAIEKRAGEIYSTITGVPIPQKPLHGSALTSMITQFMSVPDESKQAALAEIEQSFGKESAQKVLEQVELLKQQQSEKQAEKQKNKARNRSLVEQMSLGINPNSTKGQ